MFSQRFTVMSEADFLGYSHNGNGYYRIKLYNWKTHEIEWVRTSIDYMVNYDIRNLGTGYVISANLTKAGRITQVAQHFLVIDPFTKEMLIKGRSLGDLLPNEILCRCGHVFQNENHFYNHKWLPERNNSAGIFLP